MELFELFENEDKRKEALEAVEALKLHPGWKIVELVLDANIKYLEEQILQGIDRDNDDIKVAARLYREDLSRDKAMSFRELKNTPGFILEKLGKKEEKEPENPDPYFNADELK